MKGNVPWTWQHAPRRPLNWQNCQGEPKRIVKPLFEQCEDRGPGSEEARIQALLDNELAGYVCGLGPRGGTSFVDLPSTVIERKAPTHDPAAANPTYIQFLV